VRDPEPAGVIRRGRRGRQQRCDGDQESEQQAPLQGPAASVRVAGGRGVLSQERPWLTGWSIDWVGGLAGVAVEPLLWRGGMGS
jgi:hypothetical protein